MIRVCNELVQLIQQLNELCRTGNVPSIVKALDVLLQSSERGETFGDCLTSDRLTQLENLIISLGKGTAIIPAAALEELNRQQLCQRLSITNANSQAQ